MSLIQEQRKALIAQNSRRGCSARFASLVAGHSGLLVVATTHNILMTHQNDSELLTAVPDTILFGAFDFGTSIAKFRFEPEALGDFAVGFESEAGLRVFLAVGFAG